MKITIEYDDIDNDIKYEASGDCSEAFLMNGPMLMVVDTIISSANTKEEAFSFFNNMIGVISDRLHKHYKEANPTTYEGKQ